MPDSFMLICNFGGMGFVICPISEVEEPVEIVLRTEEKEKPEYSGHAYCFA